MNMKLPTIYRITLKYVDIKPQIFLVELLIGIQHLFAFNLK